MSSFKLKLLLTGMETLGKTSLIQNLTKNRFKSDHKHTLGVDILTKNVEFRNGETATLSIWDIGDDERFKLIRNDFYKGSAGALLVFDLAQEPTYLKIREWFTEIKSTIGSIPFVLVGNSINLNKLADKDIIREKAQEFARSEGGIYIEASPTNIDILEGVFRTFTRQIIESRA